MRRANSNQLHEMRIVELRRPHEIRHARVGGVGPEGVVRLQLAQFFEWAQVRWHG